jgi:hypothetical protein
MSSQQPKPESKKFADLIYEIEHHQIKVPKFQRDVVWSIENTAKLLDSILKGYPIGTFILWQTTEKMSGVRNIGDIDIGEAPEGEKVQYVLDGQQRITSLFAAYRGAKIDKRDYSRIYVDLEQDVEDDDGQVVAADQPMGAWTTLGDVLNLMDRMPQIQAAHTPENFKKIHAYHKAFSTYDFSTVLLRKESIDSAIAVFTRINTGGQPLDLFDIVAAKTYDEAAGFDMKQRWEDFIERLEENKYGAISHSVILNLLSLVFSPGRECKRSAILKLEKQTILSKWGGAVSSIEHAIDYFRRAYGIPVSRLLPYDMLLVPFAYFFLHNGQRGPDTAQAKLLEEFFWRAALSERYSGTVDTSLAQDIRRIDDILKSARPSYDDIRVQLEGPNELINREFRTSSSYCKAILCLLAQQEPKDFDSNIKVTLGNAWLKVGNSKNYHHFFPKDFLKKRGVGNENSLMNITLVSEHLNKAKIRARGPSDYILGDFAKGNDKIGQALALQFIGLEGFGIESDDYDVFLRERALRIYREIKDRLEPGATPAVDADVQGLLRSGESDSVEFKETLRYDVHTRAVSKNMEHAVAKAIAAFLNTHGGRLLIGVTDKGVPVGLSADYSTLKKKDQDGFALQLTEVIKTYLGVDLIPYIKISFPETGGERICMVKVSKSGRSVFVAFEGRQDFFVRDHGSSRPLTREEQSLYEKQRWAS